MDHQHNSARLAARLPADVHAMLKRAAEIEGRQAALRTIQETELVTLSLDDQHRVAAAWLAPPRPAPALRRAFARRRKLLIPV